MEKAEDIRPQKYFSLCKFLCFSFFILHFFSYFCILEYYRAMKFMDIFLKTQKMKRIQMLLLLGLFAWLPATVSAQNELEHVVNLIKHGLLFNKLNPQEKVYLHFDNTGYFKGERIFFKAYSIRTDTGAPSNISKVLYVELLNPSGDVVQTHKVKMENGVGYGDLPLDSVFGTGFYEVRAYTRYMRNWGNDVGFSRVFPVYRKPKVEGDYMKPQIDELSYIHRLPDGRAKLDAGYVPGKKRSSNSYKVGFYPEGGDLVVGLTSKVAFRVLDEDGRFAEVMGIVTDPQGNDVCTVSSNSDGLGLFELTPSIGTYKLVLTTAEGKRQDFKLPEAKADGCVLSVNTLDDNITAGIRSSDGLEGQLLGYTLMNRGNVVSYDTLSAEPLVELEFDRQQLPAGVNQLTVFNAQGQILGERLFFVCPMKSDNDSIHLTTTTTELRPCGKVRVEVKSAPNAELSFSAMDAATLTDGKTGNAMTWMLLSSDVKGYIANPDYYFEADDRQHRQASDLLMMVQGWRRYDWHLYTGAKKWKDIDGFPGKFQPIENQLYIHGQLKPDQNKWRKKHPVSGVDLRVFLFNTTGENATGEHYTGEAVTDSVGGYAFKMPDLEGEWEMQMQTKYNDKNAAYTVAIDRHFSPEPRYLSPYETEPVPLPEPFVKAKEEAANAEKDNTLAKRNGVYVIPTVKIKKRYFTDSSNSPWFDENTGARKSTVYYNIDEATDQIQDKGEPLPTIYQWLKEKNAFFTGDDELREMYQVTTIDEEGDVVSTQTNGEIVPVDGDVTDDYRYVIYKGGLRYKNRPILWIVNNQYVTISQYTANTYTVNWTGNTSGAERMPDFIDEVKSVYVSEDDDAYTNYIRANELASMHPITVYLYVHKRFYNKEKGIRRTHFQGFNKPTTFQMEDYTNLPPMEDFRRTLFWKPDLRTDANGNAVVEFFNNSSCKHIYYSAEGIDQEGKPLVSE